MFHFYQKYLHKNLWSGSHYQRNLTLGMKMKIHYTVHVLLLAIVVYLSAQVNNTSKGNSDIPLKEAASNNDETQLNSLSNDFKRQLSNKDKELKLLEKTTEVAKDKIKSLNKEITKLTLENDELKKDSLAQVKNPARRFSNLFNSNKMSREKSLSKFYGPLFDKLGLNENEQKEFIALMQNGNSSSFMMINGVPFSGNNKVSDELKNFLGNDLAVFENYKKTAMARSKINTMNNNLTDEDKLSLDDQEVLVNLLDEKKQAQIKGNKISNEELLQRADFLNNKQKDAFEKQLKSPITYIKSTSFSIQ